MNHINVQKDQPTELRKPLNKSTHPLQKGTATRLFFLHAVGLLFLRLAPPSWSTVCKLINSQTFAKMCNNKYSKMGRAGPKWPSAAERSGAYLRPYFREIVYAKNKNIKSRVLAPVINIRLSIVALLHSQRLWGHTGWFCDSTNWLRL